MKIENYGKWSSIVDKIRKVSVKNNFPTYIVGGWVRDKILGREPKDLDIMVDGEGAGMKLAELLSQEYGGHEPVLFPRFGTAKLTIDGEDVEFVAPRKEYYEPNNRKPKTELGTIQQDAMRRDFSVNALFIDLRTNEVLDLTGNGLNDIKQGVLRVADTDNPDIIMDNDPLRLMRLVRQASQLNFSIDPETYAAVKKNASKITSISKERVQEELNKMLLTDKPSRALFLLKDSGLLSYISPDLNSLESTEEELGTSSKNVWNHTLQVVDNTPKNLVVRLSALFHDIGKPKTKSRTYKVTCPDCAKPIEYIYKSQPEIGIVCENGSCGGSRQFKSEKELYEAFPDYDIHFYDHERVGAESAKRILTDLKYSDEIIKEVNSLITHHMRPHGYHESWNDASVRRLNRETHPYTQNLLDLNKADITTKNLEKRKKYTDRVEALRERMRVLNEQMESAKIRSPLNGNELMAMFPDKDPKTGWLKNIMNFLLDEVIEGRLAQDDKEGAKKLIQNMDINTLASEDSKIRLSFRE